MGLCSDQDTTDTDTGAPKYQSRQSFNNQINSPTNGKGSGKKKKILYSPNLENIPTANLVGGRSFVAPFSLHPIPKHIEKHMMGDDYEYYEPP